MIDNFDIILPLIKPDKGEFYYLQILQRKKDNPEIGSNSRVIKNYYIKSFEHLLHHKEEIIKLCEVFNARASIRLNKRNWRKVAFKTLENIANTMQNEAEYEHIRKCYDRACGLSHHDSQKKWIIDIDKDEVIWTEQIQNAIYYTRPYGNKIISTIPSKDGRHLITTPFDVVEFKNKLRTELKDYKMFDEINLDIHKDNPTNLYIP